MREIKFRAFWRDTKEEIEDFCDEYIIDACNDDLFEVMQYTGLKDKNGVEVYEGDVVKYPSLAYNPERDPYILVDVVFSEGEYALRSTGYSLFEMQNELEVIGNIFQNPELLEVGK